MLFWSLLLACYNDRYLNHPVTPEANTAAPAPTVQEEPPCEGVLIEVTPETVAFTSILTPWEEEIALRTDTQSITINSLCDVDQEVYVATSGGEVGDFAIVREEGDRDGERSGEFVFTVHASESPERTLTYTADDRARVAEYDEGSFDAYVIQGGEFSFHATATLEATIIDVLMAE